MRAEVLNSCLRFCRRLGELDRDIAAIAVGRPVKSVAVAELLPREGNDLVRVSNEVADAVRDRRQDVGLESLDNARLFQAGLIQVFDDRVRFGDGGPQTIQQQIGLDPIATGKLCFAIPLVGALRYAGYDPLTKIAAQMQQQVSSAVVRLVRTEPDLIDTELTQAMLDFLHRLFQLVEHFPAKQFVDRAVFRCRHFSGIIVERTARCRGNCSDVRCLSYRGNSAGSNSRLTHQGAQMRCAATFGLRGMLG